LLCASVVAEKSQKIATRYCVERTDGRIDDDGMIDSGTPTGMQRDIAVLARRWTRNYSLAPWSAPAPALN